MTTEALQSILVIAEQSRNWENACALIAKLAKEALSQPTPLAPWTREELSAQAGGLLADLREVVGNGLDLDTDGNEIVALVRSHFNFILSRPAPTVCPENQGVSSDNCAASSPESGRGNPTLANREQGQ